MQVLGENFSWWVILPILVFFSYFFNLSYNSHSVSNPDMSSETQLLKQLAPEIDDETLKKLVLAFQDLRRGYDSGKLTYPYSLRGRSYVDHPSDNPINS